MSCAELTKGLAEQAGLGVELESRIVGGLLKSSRKWGVQQGRFCCWTDRNWWCHVVERRYEDEGREMHTIDAVFSDNQGNTMLMGIVNGHVVWDNDGLGSYLLEWDLV